MKRFFNRKATLLLIVVLAACAVNGQTFLFFQDSPATDQYEYSWMELTTPSELERVGNELRRFPVESLIMPIQGINSLRLKWRSVTGGDWVAIAAGLNWTDQNLTQTDSLIFWLRSSEGLGSNALPRIFMEDINNVKTFKHSFATWCPALSPGVWKRISIPMHLFLDYGDPVDFSRIKTIGFAQGITDGVEHTLMIDDMRVITGTGTSPPASPPTGLTARGFDSHAELAWNPNPETYITGYEVQRSVNAGADWTTVFVTGKTVTHHIDWLRPAGTAVTALYRIRALNASYEPSAPSGTATANTSVFSDDELLDMVQEYTFRYFWDFAHPASGMARERNTSDNVVTTGGSGFGIMAILTGIERGFIAREQGRERMLKIITFLEQADRFHGAWPHWLNGNTGKVIPFSESDNGGDLVETAFLVQGLLTARQYFNQSHDDEIQIANRITNLWESVEWDWYSRNNSGVLYWHWSPNYGWQMNMQIRGWNEAAVVYLLAMASPTHPVPPSYWSGGWAGMPFYINGKSFFGYTLDVGWDKGGPLFFAHYSFLGFNPSNLRDPYTNYFNLNRNHTLINRAYCIQNPLGHAGYGPDCWGLTASDDPDGYLAHEPVTGRDNGTISPTAAISSMPYTPAQSLSAMKYFYRELGARTWGYMGFYDAFNQSRNWWATSYLAIDQGPIIGMIENYRSGLLWDNFMANPEIEPMLAAAGFAPDPNGFSTQGIHLSQLTIHPNPAGETTTITAEFRGTFKGNIRICDPMGRIIQSSPVTAGAVAGKLMLELSTATLPAGSYILTLSGSGIAYTGKLLKR